MMINILKSLRKYVFLGLLLVALFSFFHFQLYEYFTLSTIKRYETTAQEWTSLHYQSAVIIYVLTYIAMIACAIPCATILTLIGGFLFGTSALLYAVFSTTIGGMLLFLAIRTAIGSRLATKSTGWVKKMEMGFQKNAFNYLLSLRLVPIFPCWVSNIAAGILNVPLKTFIGATVIGILPATLIYVLAGRGLDKILTDESAPLLNIILTPSIFFPLLGLAFLSILPIIHKSVKKLNQTS